MLLVLLIFALLGMSFLGGLYTEDSGYSLHACPGGLCPDGLAEKPRPHFDYFTPAFLTCFLITTGAWVDPLQPAVDVAGGTAVAFVVLVALLYAYFRT